MVPFKIIKSENGDAWVESGSENIHHHKFPFVLQNLKKMQRYLGEKLKRLLLQFLHILMTLKDKQQKMLVK